MKKLYFPAAGKMLLVFAKELLSQFSKEERETFSAVLVYYNMYTLCHFLESLSNTKSALKKTTMTKFQHMLSKKIPDQIRHPH
jgi:hypothetical protein